MNKNKAMSILSDAQEKYAATPGMPEIIESIQDMLESSLSYPVFCGTLCQALALANDTWVRQAYGLVVHALLVGASDEK